MWRSAKTRSENVQVIPTHFNFEASYLLLNSGSYEIFLGCHWVELLGHRLGDFVRVTPIAVLR